LSWRRALAALGFIAAIGVSAETRAQTMPVGVVKDVHGSVSVARGGSTRPLRADDEVFAGDRITSSARATIAISLGNASLTLYGPGAITITTDTARPTLALDTGMLSYSSTDVTHVIRTPNAIVTPEPNVHITTAAYIEDRVGHSEQPNDTTSICASDGTLVAHALGGSRITLRSGQCVTIRRRLIGPVFPGVPAPWFRDHIDPTVGDAGGRMHPPS